MEWSEEVIGQLRALWGEGHSTAEIGRRLGVTKNAIVGKAHRLDLPARPSPIRRDPNAAPVRRATVRRVEGPTLPPLPSTVADSDANFPSFSSGSATQTHRAPAVARRVAPVPRPIVQAPRPVSAPSPRPVAVAPRPYGRIVTCCWPLGEPGTREFRFCDVPSEPGRPYCEDHVKIAYVKVRDRRDDAA